MDRSSIYKRDPVAQSACLPTATTGSWSAPGRRPLASEWIHYTALAIRAKIPISVLLDQVAQFPAYTEAWLAALEQLSL